MSRILFLTSAHPGGRGCIGAGEGVSEGNLRSLVDGGHEVHVLCFSPAGQSPHPDMVSLCASYRSVNHSSRQSVRAILANAKYGALLAPWLFTRISPDWVTEVNGAIARRQIDRIWIEFPSSLGFTRFLEGRKVDYFVHDVVSQKVGRKPLLKVLQPWVAAIESKLLGLVERCYVMSQKDGALLREIGFEGAVLVEPPRSIKVGEVGGAIPVDRIVDSIAAGKSLVYFGNMARPENHMSMICFLLSGYRRIRRACPGVEFWIIGLGPRRSLRLLAKLFKGVHITGPVDDPTPAFTAATLCLAPVYFGAGVKIKVLQMLEAGAKVVATPIGAEGIPGADRLIVAENRLFAQRVIDELRAS